MSTVWKHPKSPYWTAVFLNEQNIWQRKTTKKKNRTEALQVASEWERAAKMGREMTLTESLSREIIGGILERTTGQKLRCDSVKDYCAKWLNNKTTTKKAADITIVRYKRVVERFTEVLGKRAELPLSAITTDDCSKFTTRLSSLGMAASTLIAETKVLQSIFSSARREGLISTNPAEALELPETRLPVERGTFTPEQVRLVILAARKIADKYEQAKKPETAKQFDEWPTAILLGFYAGLRLSDATTLDWSSVDFTNSLLNVKVKKTGKPVIVPLHPTLDAHLSKLAGDSAGPVCPSLATATLGGSHGLSSQFIAIMKEAGISNMATDTGGINTLSKLSFHALRKTFNSELHNQGVDQEMRMKLTGHRSRSINDIYTKTELKPLRDAASKLPEIKLD